jgi:K+ transporter
VAATQENVLGVLSLVFWSLTFVVTVKYLGFVMKADNRGEGGILALLALVGRRRTSRPGRRALLTLGLFGAALLYGDGVITPAISVLGAVEGLGVAGPALGHLVVPVTVAIGLFLADVEKHPPHRIPGTAIFMTSNPEGVPPVLLHHLKHNKVLHERVVLVSILTEEVPAVPEAERVVVRGLGAGFYQVVGRYGFMETPDVPALLASLPPWSMAGPRLELVPMETTYYLGRETLLPTGPGRMSSWRKRLFVVMARNAQTASAFFGLPPNRVVELGAQIQL